MRLSGLTLISASLLTLSACSMAPVVQPPEIRVVKEIEHPVPPKELIKPCLPAQNRKFVVTKDIVDSRQDWISAFCDCASQMNRLIEWVSGTLPKEFAACPKNQNE